MNFRFAFAVLALLLGSAQAADKPPTSQQQRFGACSKEASSKSLAGDARKAFMSDCASGKTAVAAAPRTPQERMTACNKDAAAKQLSGQPRKDFMSSCLKAG
ncbi:PsiF family protein [Derxia lacustris]|uniref:PsiF family protein n=1 Tax=Derxia lacustris TaxID=764842 RepID=UPI000A17667E|nr:PsiF family protein [Derxia lacustris]